MNRVKEFEFVLGFAAGEDFDYGVSCDQLRSLWMAYCIHNDIDVDTATYDDGIMKIWSCMVDGEVPHQKWADFRDFDLYMGEYLC